MAAVFLYIDAGGQFLTRVPALSNAWIVLTMAVLLTPVRLFVDLVTRELHTVVLTSTRLTRGAASSAATAT